MFIASGHGINLGQTPLMKNPVGFIMRNYIKKKLLMGKKKRK
jgi:hypothetical protein